MGNQGITSIQLLRAGGGQEATQGLCACAMLSLTWVPEYSTPGGVLAKRPSQSALRKQTTFCGACP